MTCKTCQYLNVPPDKLGRRLVRKGSAYPCTHPDPPLPLLPDSMLRQYAFRWPPIRSWMSSHEGKDCATYLRLGGAPKAQESSSEPSKD